MLKFVKEMFSALLEIILWINLIAWAIIGLTNGFIIGDFIRGYFGEGYSEAGATPAIIGLIIGLIIGIVINTFSGWLFAIILSIDKSLEKISNNLEEIGNNTERVSNTLFEGGRRETSTSVKIPGLNC